ncbi:MAG TPA: hypothetical protein VMQ63_09335 [Stellaceae bacterium]|jgi:hypothetical protein|nr:hypothetical protein [Stellaceae bacterium]
MAIYRFDYLNAEDQPVGVLDNVDLADDAAAGVMALRLLNEESNRPGIEIWQGKRMVARHHR